MIGWRRSGDAIRRAVVGWRVALRLRRRCDGDHGDAESRAFKLVIDSICSFISSNYPLSKTGAYMPHLHVSTGIQPDEKAQCNPKSMEVHSFDKKACQFLPLVIQCVFNVLDDFLTIRPQSFLRKVDFLPFSSKTSGGFRDLGQIFCNFYVKTL